MAHILKDVDHLMEGDEYWLPPEINIENSVGQEKDYEGLPDPGMWSPAALANYPWDDPQDLHALHDNMGENIQNIAATPNNTLSQNENRNDIANHADSPLYSPTRPMEGYPSPTNYTNTQAWLVDLDVGSPGNGIVSSPSRFPIDEEIAWQQSPWGALEHAVQDLDPNDLLNSQDLALLTSITGAPQEVRVADPENTVPQGSHEVIKISIEDSKTKKLQYGDLMITNNPSTSTKCREYVPGGSGEEVLNIEDGHLFVASPKRLEWDEDMESSFVDSIHTIGSHHQDINFHELYESYNLATSSLPTQVQQSEDNLFHYMIHELYVNPGDLSSELKRHGRTDDDIIGDEDRSLKKIKTPEMHSPATRTPIQSPVRSSSPPLNTLDSPDPSPWTLDNLLSSPSISNLPSGPPQIENHGISDYIESCNQLAESYICQEVPVDETESQALDDPNTPIVDLTAREIPAECLHNEHNVPVNYALNAQEHPMWATSSSANDLPNQTSTDGFSDKQKLHGSVSDLRQQEDENEDGNDTNVDGGTKHLLVPNLRRQEHENDTDVEGGTKRLLVPNLRQQDEENDPNVEGRTKRILVPMVRRAEEGDKQQPIYEASTRIKPPTLLFEGRPQQLSFTPYGPDPATQWALRARNAQPAHRAAPIQQHLIGQEWSTLQILQAALHMQEKPLAIDWNIGIHPQVVGAWMQYFPDDKLLEAWTRMESHNKEFFNFKSNDIPKWSPGMQLNEASKIYRKYFPVIMERKTRKILGFDYEGYKASNISTREDNLSGWIIMPSLDWMDPKVIGNVIAASSGLLVFDSTKAAPKYIVVDGNRIAVDDNCWRERETPAAAAANASMANYWKNNRYSKLQSLLTVVNPLTHELKILPPLRVKVYKDKAGCLIFPSAVHSHGYRLIILAWALTEATSKQQSGPNVVPKHPTEEIALAIFNSSEGRWTHFDAIENAKPGSGLIGGRAGCAVLNFGVYYGGIRIDLNSGGEKEREFPAIFYFNASKPRSQHLVYPFFVRDANANLRVVDPPKVVRAGSNRIFAATREASGANQNQWGSIVLVEILLHPDGAPLGTFRLVSNGVMPKKFLNILYKFSKLPIQKALPYEVVSSDTLIAFRVSEPNIVLYDILKAEWRVTKFSSVESKVHTKDHLMFEGTYEPAWAATPFPKTKAKRQ